MITCNMKSKQKPMQMDRTLPVSPVKMSMNTLNRDHMTFIKVGPLNTATSVFSLNSARRVSEFSVPLCYSVSDTVKAGEYHKTWLETKTEILFCIEEIQGKNN